MVFLLSYDLVGNYRDPADYVRLEQKIQNVGSTWFHFQKSEWLIESTLSAVAIRDALGPFIQPGDRLMVNRITNEWAAYSLTDAEVQWLNQRNFGEPGVPLLGLPRFR